MRDELKIKKMESVIKEKEKEGYKVLRLDMKPDFIIIKNGKITAMRILKKIKGNRTTPSHGHNTYCGFSEKIRINTAKEDFQKLGFDNFDYEVVQEDRT